MPPKDGPSIRSEILTALETADYVVGSDECGYGAYAGPLVVCAAIVSKNWPLAHLVKDSKAFKGDHREINRGRVASQIIQGLTWALVSYTAAQVDEAGIYSLLPLAHQKAIEEVLAKHAAEGVIGEAVVIVDGSLKVTYGPDNKQALSQPQGDEIIPAISAASIIGKVARDKAMTKLADKYPGYGFESNKGYNSPAHEEGLQKLGICEIHRKSFGPIRKLVEQAEAKAFDFASLGGEED